jgi:hypothetical protein
MIVDSEHELIVVGSAVVEMMRLIDCIREVAGEMNTGDSIQAASLLEIADLLTTEAVEISYRMDNDDEEV